MAAAIVAGGASVAPAIADGTGASGATGVGSTGASGASGPSAGATGGSSGPTRLTRVPATALRNGTAPITVALNGAPDPSGPKPALHPNVAGTWSIVGDAYRFTPASTLAPCGSYELAISAGTVAVGRTPLGSRHEESLSVACPSVTALQEALARLNYLPYTLRGFSGINLNVPLTTAVAAQRAYDPPHAYLRPRYRDVPSLKLGEMDPTTTGALEIWEQDHDVTIGTAPDAAIWHRLLIEEAMNYRNPRPYTWVTVTEQTRPELLEVHENGRVVIKSPANTGVPGATTQTGEFPIYVRYTSTTMIGTNVDGTHYDDPGIPWVNYFNGGDAVHGYPRASYGFPQSNGCVELPIPAAAKVYPLLAVGDMVDVED